MKRNLNRDMDFFSNNATRIVYLFPRHVKFMNIWTLVIVFISLFFPTYKQSVFFYYSIRYLIPNSVWINEPILCNRIQNSEAKWRSVIFSFFFVPTCFSKLIVALIPAQSHFLWDSCRMICRYFSPWNDTQTKPNWKKRKKGKVREYLTECKVRIMFGLGEREREYWEGEEKYIYWENGL